MVCMFVASKYEDIIPLFLKTIVNRVGHGKYDTERVQKMEKEIIAVLRFKMASVPTVLEFQETFLQSKVFRDHPEGDTFRNLARYLAFL